MVRTMKPVARSLRRVLPRCADLSVRTAGAVTCAPHAASFQSVGEVGSRHIPHPAALSMGYLCALGADDRRRQEHGKFVRNYLRASFAQIIVELKTFSSVLTFNNGINEVARQFEDLYSYVNDFPVRETSDRSFVELIMYLIGLQHSIIETMALAVQELKDNLGERYDVMQPQVQALWQRFATARIATQLLMENYLASLRSRDGFAGVFQLEGNPGKLVEDVAMESMELSNELLGKAPEIFVRENTPSAFTYVPRYLRYVFGEVFKNACRAVVENQPTWCSRMLPPVVCEVEHRDDRVSVKVTDQGGGMSFRGLQNAWNFMHSSTRESPWAAQGAVLSGYGIGLPMSRVVAQHFGGDVRLKSKEGDGTEVTITLANVKASDV